MNINKREYVSPKLEQIQLDNEISLVLESNPPTGPNEGLNKAPECLIKDPYKSNVG